MKFYMVLAIALVILATTAQGFILKSALKKKLSLLILPSLTQKLQAVPSSLGSTSTHVLPSPISSLSGALSSLSEQDPEQDQPEPISESFESPLSAAIPPTVTLYAYPPQRQVIYRTIRPVVSRTVYDQGPTYSDRAVPGIGNPMPAQLSGALTAIKSLIGNVLMPTTTPPLASGLPAALPVPNTYYIY